METNVKNQLSQEDKQIHIKNLVNALNYGLITWFEYFQFYREL